MNAPRRAVMVIAHGSRRAEANADLDYFAEGLRASGRFDFVSTAYLELAKPTIPDAAVACVRSGATEVIMSPFFLSPGMHVTEDLEAFRAGFVKEYPAVMFRLAEPLGRHPLLVEILLQRAGEVKSHNPGA